MKSIAQFIRNTLGTRCPRKILHKGVIMPPKYIRFGGSYFWCNDNFLESGKRDTKRLVEWCKLNLHSSILDIGCGPGRLPIGILQELGEIQKYSAIDVHKPSITWCKKFIEEKHPSFIFTHINIKNVRYNPNGTQELSDMKLPFKSNSFDIINLLSVFTHLLQTEIESYLKEFQRLLKKNGSVLLSAFVEENVPEVTENPSNYGKRKWKGALHCIRYEKSFLEGLFRKYDFKIKHFENRKTIGSQSIYILEIA